MVWASVRTQTPGGSRANDHLSPLTGCFSGCLRMLRRESGGRRLADGEVGARSSRCGPSAEFLLDPSSYRRKSGSHWRKDSKFCHLRAQVRAHRVRGRKQRENATLQVELWPGVFQFPCHGGKDMSLCVRDTVTEPSLPLLACLTSKLTFTSDTIAGSQKIFQKLHSWFSPSYATWRSFLNGWQSMGLGQFPYSRLQK